MILKKFDTTYPEQTNCRKVHYLIFMSFVVLCDVIIFERIKNYGGKKTFWKSSSARWVITAILYIVVFKGILFCDAFLSAYLPDGFELLIIIPGAVFAYFGWKALNRI